MVHDIIFFFIYMGIAVGVISLFLVVYFLLLKDRLDN